VRGAQLLLKAIFERIQHTLNLADHIQLSPQCLHSIMSGKKPLLSEFLRTTDTEILFMVREFAERHSDPILRYLCQAFVNRQFPKAILNTAKLSGDLTAEYRIEAKSPEMDDQLALPLQLVTPHARVDREQFDEDVRRFTEVQLANAELPKEIAQYLVTWDSPTLPSAPAPNLLLDYGGKTVSFDDINATEAGKDFAALLTPFSLERFYVPRAVADNVEKYVRQNYYLDHEETEVVQ
jgi:hypothetical protein